MHTIRDAVYGSLQQVSNYSPVISIFVNRFLDASLLSEPFHVAHSNMLLNNVTVMTSVHVYAKAYTTMFPCIHLYISKE